MTTTTVLTRAALCAAILSTTTVLTRAALCAAILSTTTVLGCSTNGTDNAQQASTPSAASNTHTLGCWDEPNTAMPTGYGQNCGQLSSMPSGSVHVRAYPYVEEDGTACRTDILPHSCAPANSPSGAHVVYVEEDGSATYADGLVYDPESHRFSRISLELKSYSGGMKFDTGSVLDTSQVDDLRKDIES